MARNSISAHRLSVSDRLAKFAFVVSTLVLVFGFGVAVVQYRIFPYEILKDAKNAVDALMLLEDDTLMTGVTRVDPNAPAAPIVTQLDPSAGSEKLLIIGGFYQYMERCPQFGCLAWIIDREGNILFSWEVDPAQLVARAGRIEGFSKQLLPRNIYPVGSALLPDGSLVLTFHIRNNFPYQVGIAKITKDSEIAWVKFDNSHHWIDTDPAGRIYAPSAKVIETPEYYEDTLIVARCFDNKTFYEGVRVYEPDGSVVRDIWIGESFAASNYPGLLYSKNGCDPAHLNSVEVVSTEIARILPGIDAGDLLISVREPSVVAIVDSETGLIKRLSSGRTAAQHGPQFLPDGTVAVFDNLGSNRDLGGARIIRLNLDTNEAETLFPRDLDGPFVPLESPDGGHISVSPDGQRLIFTSKHQSRSVEIDIATGRPLWVMEKTFDIRPYLKLKNATADADFAWFNAYGTIYLDDADTAFLNH